MWHVLTCKMKKPAQLAQLDMSMTVPTTQCWSEGSVVLLLELLWWLMAPPPFMIWKAGPLYRVITIAPETVMTVPMTLARLWNFLKFTFSSLVGTIIFISLIRFTRINLLQWITKKRMEESYLISMCLDKRKYCCLIQVA